MRVLAPLILLVPLSTVAATKTAAKPKADFCAPVKSLVAMAEKNDGFKGARGEIVVKDGGSKPNAWISKTVVPGAKCWVLAGGAMAECDFPAADTLGDLDTRLRSCATADWKDRSGGGKTIYGKGKAGISLEIFAPDASAMGEKPRPRLTIFAPPSADDGADLLGD